MSEWNYTKCTKPFASAEAAESYMVEKDFAGYVLERSEGFAAVCPAYPEGFYPDAKVVSEVENSSGELRSTQATTQATTLATSCCEG